MIWLCQNCNEKWYYPVKRCIFCKGDIKKDESQEFTIEGFTEVSIPSSEHLKVPYQVLLLKDSNGNFKITKSTKKLGLGEKLNKNIEDVK